MLLIISPDSSCYAFMSHSSSIPVMITDDTPMPFAGVFSVVTPNLSLSLSLSLMYIIF